MKQRNLTFAILTFLLTSHWICVDVHAQSNPASESLTIMMDSLFSNQDDLHTPGAAMIIIQDQEVLITEHGGAANLTHNIPFTANSEFPLEGFTEQLVILALLQLDKDLRLSLNDPINSYLPELGFSDKIHLSHLLNHSSGLAMISSLRLMAGWKYTDPFTHDDFINLTNSVSEDATPDESFVHNHGGIKILMMVIEQLTGVEFGDYAAERIFAPLGMHHTSIKSRDILKKPHSTHGYTQTDTGFEETIPTTFEIFCPRTYTTQTDFTNWMLNIETKTLWADILNKMDGTLTISGQKVERSYGSYCIGQQQYRHYLGQDEFFIRETGNGYSWMWLRIPGAQLSVMAIGNLESYIGPQVNAVADLLGEYSEPTTAIESTEVELSQQEMESCIGTYWNDKYMYTTLISIQGEALYHSDTDNGFNFALTPISKTRFLTPFGGTIEFSNLGSDHNRMKNVIPNGREFDYTEYHVPTLDEAGGSRYLGAYASEQLGSFYQIVWQEGKLILRRNRKSDLVLSPLGNDQFRTNEIDFRLISFKNELGGSFRTMTMSNYSVKDQEFHKL